MTHAHARLITGTLACCCRCPPQQQALHADSSHAQGNWDDTQWVAAPVGGHKAPFGGALVTLVLLWQVKTCTESHDFAEPAGRIQVMLASMNLYRLVQALLKRAPPLDCRAPLMVPEERDHGTVIVRYPNHVTKHIYNVDSFFEMFGTSFDEVEVRRRHMRNNDTQHG